MNKFFYIVGGVFLLVLILAAAYFFVPVYMCGNVEKELHSYIDDHKYCDVVSDCSVAWGTGCFYGLVGRDADKGYISGLREKYFSLGCSWGMAPECMGYQGNVVSCEENACVFKGFDELDSIHECVGMYAAECIYHFIEGMSSSYECHEISEMEFNHSMYNERYFLNNCLYRFTGEEGCGILPVDSEIRDSCFYEQARESQDRTLCFYSGERLSECFSEFAVQLDNPEVCEEIGGDYWGRRNCYYSYAINTNTYSLCDAEIVGSSNVRPCLRRISEQTGNLEICDELLVDDQDQRDLCYLVIARNQNNADLCNEIHVNSIREQCLEQIR